MTDNRPGPHISRRCSCGVLHPDHLDCPGPPAADVQAHANRIRALLTAERIPPRQRSNDLPHQPGNVM